MSTNNWHPENSSKQSCNSAWFFTFFFLFWTNLKDTIDSVLCWMVMVSFCYQYYFIFQNKCYSSFNTLLLLLNRVFLCYTLDTHYSSILYILCIYVDPNILIHSSSLPPPHGSVLHLCLYFCFENKFICNSFLDSTCKWY